MPFLSHVDELRSRLIRSLWVFVGGFAICYFWLDKWVLEILRRPLFEALPPEQRKLYFTGLFENFFTHLKMSGVAAIFLLAPYFFYQVWSFISPGLRTNERKMVLPFVGIATFFFLAGAAFAYFLLFPIAFKFFLSYGLESDVPMLTIGSYYGTVLKLLLLFGLAFEMPVIISLLGALGILDGSTLRRSRKTAIVVITVVSGVVAPPDAISMLLLMAPLILMYEGSIWVVEFMARRRARALMTAARQ